MPFRPQPVQPHLLGGSRSPRNQLPGTPGLAPREVVPMQLPQPFHHAPGYFAAAMQEVQQPTSHVRVRSSSTTRPQATPPSVTRSITLEHTERLATPASPALGSRLPATVPLTPDNREEPELAAGAHVKIHDTVCRITKPLGMGSFGAVWAAEGPGGSDLAVKEILCHSKVELLNALFESHLLKVFGGSGDKSRSSTGGAGLAEPLATPRCIGIVPSLIACGTSCIGKDEWRVRLAMTRIHGEPLDTFLEERRRQHRKDRQKLKGDNGAPAARTVEKHFAEACFFARELLTQLVPCFEQISAIALHRDTNSHNILIDNSSGKPQYGLVDFGLAVDSICWRSDEASGASGRHSRVGKDGVCTWHFLDVGGDCRYWPLSAWMQFLAGWHELDAIPALSFEYKMQLDLHALGVTVMQILAELLPLPSDLSEDSFDAATGRLALKSTQEHLALPAEVWKLRIVWDRYWNRVSPLHSQLIHTFHNRGDWNKLKIDCIEGRVHDKLAEDLRLLRCTMREALDACRKLENTAEATPSVPSGVCGLLAAMLKLVSDGQGEEMAHGPYAWQVVSSLLSQDGSVERATPGGAKATASNCSTAASTGGSQEHRDNAAAGRLSPSMPEASADPQRLAHASSLPYVLLPRPRRISQEEGGGTPRAMAGIVAGSTWSFGQPTAVLSSPSGTIVRSSSGSSLLRPGSISRRPNASPPRESNGSYVGKLSDLKEQVDWLAEEMAKLGDKHKNGLASHHALRLYS